MTTVLRWAAVMFAGLALVAGALQAWAFVATGGPRHLIVGTFALAVGVSVLVAVVGSLPRCRRRERRVNGRPRPPQ